MLLLLERNNCPLQRLDVKALLPRALTFFNAIFSLKYKTTTISPESLCPFAATFAGKH